jgi:hypothetical protein
VVVEAADHHALLPRPHLLHVGERYVYQSAAKEPGRQREPSIATGARATHVYDGADPPVRAIHTVALTPVQPVLRLAYGTNRSGVVRRSKVELGNITDCPYKGCGCTTLSIFEQANGRAIGVDTDGSRGELRTALEPPAPIA